LSQKGARNFYRKARTACLVFGLVARRWRKTISRHDREVWSTTRALRGECRKMIGRERSGSKEPMCETNSASAEIGVAVELKRFECRARRGKSGTSPG
jgi:hypothetical protein